MAAEPDESLIRRIPDAQLQPYVMTWFLIAREYLDFCTARQYVSISRQGWLAMKRSGYKGEGKMMRMATMFKSILACTMVTGSAIAGSVHSGLTVVAGSTMEAPPPFMLNAFWGMNSAIERAFPFELQVSGEYFVTELQVPVYHYEGMSGSTAKFSIHLDDSGSPGGLLREFHVAGITPSQDIHTSLLDESLVMAFGQRYWIIGSTPTGQVNWNLSDFALGDAAYRVNNGDWEYLSHTNISGFALLGTPVPEPATLLMLGASAMAMFARRRSSRIDAQSTNS